MKALSVKQPWASLIATREKTIETRKWKTDYRGDLLICSSKWHDLGLDRPSRRLQGDDYLYGHGRCIVRLVDCVPMTIEHEAAAMCAVYPKAWAWLLADVRPITPFPVKGKLGLFEVEVNL